MYINKMTIYGRLTRDPELKQLPSGDHVVSFSMATNESWKDKNGDKKESVEFHNLVCFGKRADVIAKWVKKGQMFYVEGQLKTQSWEDKETGKKMYRTETVVKDFKFGDNPKKDNVQQASTETEDDKPYFPEDEINPEDIPF